MGRAVLFSHKSVVKAEPENWLLQFINTNKSTITLQRITLGQFRDFTYYDIFCGLSSISELGRRQ